MVSDSGYQWGFWLYILCGTIIGALSAWMADWAAEDSCLRGVWHCILCKHCRKKSNDEKAEPLIPGESLQMCIMFDEYDTGVFAHNCSLYMVLIYQYGSK